MGAAASASTGVARVLPRPTSAFNFASLVCEDAWFIVKGHSLSGQVCHMNEAAKAIFPHVHPGMILTEHGEFERTTADGRDIFKPFEVEGLDLFKLKQEKRLHHVYKVDIFHASSNGDACSLITFKNGGGAGPSCSVVTNSSMETDINRKIPKRTPSCSVASGSSMETDTRRKISNHKQLSVDTNKKIIPQRLAVGHSPRETLPPLTFSSERKASSSSLPSSHKEPVEELRKEAEGILTHSLKNKMASALTVLDMLLEGMESNLLNAELREAHLNLQQAISWSLNREAIHQVFSNLYQVDKQHHNIMVLLLGALREIDNVIIDDSATEKDKEEADTAGEFDPVHTDSILFKMVVQNAIWKIKQMSLSGLFWIRVSLAHSIVGPCVSIKVHTEVSTSTTPMNYASPQQSPDGRRTLSTDGSGDKWCGDCTLLKQLHSAVELLGPGTYYQISVGTSKGSVTIFFPLVVSGINSSTQNKSFRIISKKAVTMACTSEKTPHKNKTHDKKDAAMKEGTSLHGCTIIGLEDSMVIRNGYNKLVLPRMAKASTTSFIFGETMSDVETFEAKVEKFKPDIILLDEYLEYGGTEYRGSSVCSLLRGPGGKFTNGFICIRSADVEPQDVDRYKASGATFWTGKGISNREFVQQLSAEYYKFKQQRGVL